MLNKEICKKCKYNEEGDCIQEAIDKGEHILSGREYPKERIYPLDCPYKLEHILKGKQK
jgi:hypothetical protein